ncbi:MAG: DNA mismatch repair endonuclease MutH [Gammaproteobacteria bacterium]|nr:MAG: DNA mismatch repair endonuclease MutH [Gammaproteobacteria bacterium]
MKDAPRRRPNPAPRSEAELLERAQEMAGEPLAALARGQGVAVPGDSRRAKGWAGQLIEARLGATAGSLSEPDFQIIGVELKTIPVSTAGEPRESTYVCTVPLMGESSTGWHGCNVQRKLARVLWVPVVSDDATEPGDRIIGWPLLWSPSRAQESALEADWQELMDMVCLGELESISAYHGTCLQIRPKAADSRARRWGIGESGEHVRTLPRGFYLRPSFTRAILRQHYAL